MAARRACAHGASWLLQRGRRPAACGVRQRGFCAGAGDKMLRGIVELNSQPFAKVSLEDLLRLQELSPEKRLGHLDRVLRIGISKIILLLQDMPLGFGSTRPMRAVILDYVQDLRELDACTPDDMEGFNACILRIFARHKDLIVQVEQGISDFQVEVVETYKPFAGFGPTRCSDVSDSVPGVRRIEESLDEFFTVRTTLRLLIAHCLQLRGEEILPAGHQGISSENCPAPAVERVGVVKLHTRPSIVLVEAYHHAQLWCRKEYNCSAKLLLNEMPAMEYLAASANSSDEGGLPYVDMHLYFVFFEVLKNALQASVRRAGGHGKLEPGHELPPIHATMVAGTSMMEENERMVKIADEGSGVPRGDVHKVWSYFYSTREHEQAPAATKGEKAAGSGLGLGVSRVLTRYFGGEIYFHSIPRKGTDVYIYL